MKNNVIKIIIMLLLVGNVYSPLYAEEGRVEREYWGNGNVKMARRYDDDDRLRAVKRFRKDGTLVHFRQFDEMGLKVSDERYGADGKTVVQ